MIKFQESAETKGKNTFIGKMGESVVRKNKNGVFYTYNETGKPQSVKKSTFFAGLSIQNPLDDDKKDENFYYA